MLENKDYCDYETCVALKELGFNDPTHFYYGGDGKYITIHGYWRPELIQRFSLYEAQKWLREEKGIIVDPIINYTTQEFDYYVSTWEEDRCRGNEYTTYENALLRGIKEAVKILKEK